MALDGELVVLDEQGKGAFEPLRRRALMRNARNIVRGERETPAAVFVFELIALRGQDLRRYPLRTRKAMLRDALKHSERIRYVQHIGENGAGDSPKAGRENCRPGRRANGQGCAAPP